MLTEEGVRFVHCACWNVLIRNLACLLNVKNHSNDSILDDDVIGLHLIGACLACMKHLRCLACG
jgi:hypothetical protein